MPMIRLSRMFAVDGIETCVQVEDENPQAALRALEHAADAIGAAPGALPFSGAAKAATSRGKKKDEPAVTAKEAEPAPALPPNVASAFPPNEPPLPFLSPQQQPHIPPAPPGHQLASTPGGYANGAGQPQVAVTNDPPPPTGSYVGLAPAAAAAPPVFAPPPPAAPAPDNNESLRRQIDDTRTMIHAMVFDKQPGWIDSVTQTMNGILAERGGDVRVMSEEHLLSALGAYRQYHDVLKQHMGLV